VKILVTGGAGFIGCHACEQLVARGHKLVVADNLQLGRREHIAHIEGHGLTFVEMDIADETALDALFAEHGFEAVFHLAANSDIAVSRENPGIDLSATFATTWSVLEAMRKHGTKQIIFASTSAIYGEAQGAIREDHGPLLPISHYGAAKLASEAFISSFVGNYGLTAWMFRFPNVVGDRATHGAIFDWARKLRSTPNRLEVLGDGTQIKPYLHVDDLIDAILLGWERASAPVNIFNVGGITRCSVARMAEIMIEEAGGGPAIHFSGGDRGWIGDVPSVEYDTSRIRALGWEPRLDSEAAVRAAARWALSV
jgi:UDP-glucose 4-epimerase